MTQKYLQLQAMFSKIGKTITSSQTQTEVVTAIMEQIGSFFKPKNWTLYRVDHTSKEVFAIHVTGLEQNFLSLLKFKLGEGIVGQVAKSGKSIVVLDANTDERVLRRIDAISQFKTKSIIAVPILFNNQTYGVIELVNCKRGRKNVEQILSVLEIIADFAAIALIHCATYECLINDIMIDPLTGVFNRKKLQSLSHANNDRTINKRKCDTSTIGVFVIDLDKFKEVNDVHGHAKGDSILKKTALILKAGVRENDLVFRTGGDEFVLILLELPLDEALIICERVIEKINKKINKMEPTVGISIGYKIGLMKDISTLIQQSDVLMYEQKMSKKLSVRTATPNQADSFH